MTDGDNGGSFEIFICKHYPYVFADYPCHVRERGIRAIPRWFSKAWLSCLKTTLLHCCCFDVAPAMAKQPVRIILLANPFARKSDERRMTFMFWRLCSGSFQPVTSRKYAACRQACYWLTGILFPVYARRSARNIIAPDKAETPNNITQVNDKTIPRSATIFPTIFQ